MGKEQEQRWERSKSGRWTMSLEAERSIQHAHSSALCSRVMPSAECCKVKLWFKPKPKKNDHYIKKINVVSLCHEKVKEEWSLYKEDQCSQHVP